MLYYNTYIHIYIYMYIIISCMVLSEFTILCSILRYNTANYTAFDNTLSYYIILCNILRCRAHAGTDTNSADRPVVDACLSTRHVLRMEERL